MSARVLAAVWVPGVPRTQGSMEHVGGGKMKHSDAMVRWRSLVKSEIERDVRVRGLDRALVPGKTAVEYWREESASLTESQVIYHRMLSPFDGPVAVRCVFVRGDGVGDIDKLARCVLDALTDSRVIADDAQVVKLNCDRVERVGGRGDGAFVLVATVAVDGFPSGVEMDVAREIDGWVGR
jgi:Holliday junction resolvase RusA-like endonuclease